MAVQGVENVVQHQQGHVRYHELTGQVSCGGAHVLLVALDSPKQRHVWRKDRCAMQGCHAADLSVQCVEQGAWANMDVNLWVTTLTMYLHVV